MGYTNVIWDYDTDDWQLPPGGTTLTPAAVDAEFTKWIAAAPTDKTGHITLEHELYQATVDAAIRNLPKIQATWKVMPVSSCMNDANPYVETNITLATMDGKAVTGVVSNTTTTTTAAAPTSAPTTGSQPEKKPNGSSATSTRQMSILGAVVAVAVAALQW